MLDRETHSRRRLGRIGEVEEGQTIAVADVEKEVLSHVAGKLDRLDQRETQDAAVEVDRALHVLTDERQMVDPGDVEVANR